MLRFTPSFGLQVKKALIIKLLIKLANLVLDISIIILHGVHEVIATFTRIIAHRFKQIIVEALANSIRFDIKEVIVIDVFISVIEIVKILPLRLIFFAKVLLHTLAIINVLRLAPM